VLVNEQDYNGKKRKPKKMKKNIACKDAVFQGDNQKKA